MDMTDTGSLCVVDIWKATHSINPMFLVHVVVCVDQFQRTDWKALEQPLLSFKEYIQASLKILSGECLLQIFSSNANYISSWAWNSGGIKRTLWYNGLRLKS